MGWSLVVGGAGALFFYVIFGAVNGTGFPPIDNCWPGVSLAAAMYIFALLFPVGVNMCLLAVGPSDANFIRVLCWVGDVLILVCVNGGCLACVSIAVAPGNLVLKGFMLLLFFPITCVLFWAAVMIRPTLSCKGSKTEWAARKKLRRLWLCIRIIFLIVGITFLVCTGLMLISLAAMHTSGIMDWIDEYRANRTLTDFQGIDVGAELVGSAHMLEYFDNIGILMGGWAAIGTSCILAGALPTPRRRGLMVRKLSKLVSSGAMEQDRAATISSLIAGRDPVRTLRDGKEAFRVLPIDALKESDIAPGANLASAAEETKALQLRTLKADLGGCDGFFSHSWRDDGVKKFAKLTEWSRQFEGQKYRLPNIWLDKACIDQTRIDESLAALPIFLQGCVELLVVTGPTYFSRLWCVMELYTFLHVGGRAKDVLLMDIDDDKEGSQEERLRAAIARFDAGKAQCFLPNDRERLLGVIEAGYGDLGAFNVEVRRLLMSSAVGAGLKGSVTV